MKTITTILLIILSINSYSQDTVYVDYLNRTYNSVPHQFIAFDTTTVKDDSTIINELLIGPTSSFHDTLENTYNSYYIEYTVEELQGGTSGFFDIDTNSTQLSFTTLSSVTGTFIDDSLKLDSSSTLSYELSASAANTTLKVLGEIYHTTTTVHVRLDLPRLDTVYFDLNTNLSVNKSFASQYPILSVKEDTTYFSDTSENVRATLTTFTHTVPTTFSNYYLIFELEHKAGGYNWDIDTNSIGLVNNTSSHMSVKGPIRDTLVVSSGSTIDYNITNVSNSGRYFATSTIFHTIDTIFINSLSTSINEIDTKNRITVYPNPTKDFLFIDGYLGKEFEIIDLQGRVVKSGILRNRIDLKELPNGVYFLKVIDTIMKILKE